LLRAAAAAAAATTTTILNSERGQLHEVEIIVLCIIIDVVIQASGTPSSANIDAALGCESGRGNKVGVQVRVVLKDAWNFEQAGSPSQATGSVTHPAGIIHAGVVGERGAPERQTA
jgi:hypothetical protein